MSVAPRAPSSACVDEPSGDGGAVVPLEGRDDLAHVELFAVVLAAERVAAQQRSSEVGQPVNRGEAATGRAALAGAVVEVVGAVVVVGSSQPSPASRS